MMQFLTTIKTSQLIGNTSWLMCTEFVAKLSRLLVILVLVATLTTIDYGIVMLALACHEIFKLLLRAGAGSQVIQCAESDLPTLAKNAAIMQWFVCLSLFLIQATSASFIESFYGIEGLATLLIGMSGVYLLYPLVSLNVFLIQRANNMRYFSLRNACCICAENLSIVVFAYLECGLLSVVYAKWVFVVFWVVLFWRAPVARFGYGFDATTFFTLFKTSSQLLATEFVRALRGQLDMLIGAKLLAPELFGVYSFAKSAGIGLSNSLSNAFNAALYPHLCQLNRNTESSRNRYIVYGLLAGVAVTFAIQAAMVPVYVPLLFSEEWSSSFNTISILCLSIIPVVLVDTYCNVLRSNAQFKKELLVRTLCLSISAVGLLVIASSSVEGFATSILFTSLAWLVVLLPWQRITYFFSYPLVLGSQNHE